MTETPLTTVYKVVKTDQEGRMFSTNLTSDQDADMFGCWQKRKSFGNRYMVQYKLNHVIVPNPHCKVLFVCPTISDAAQCQKFFREGMQESEAKKVKVEILESLAANVRPFSASDWVIVHSEDGCKRVPADFSSCICDYLIPLRKVSHIP